jgi:hypothetical protein
VADNGGEVVEGARSSYLTKKWRVVYVVEGDRFEVLVLEVNPHDY